MKFDIVQATLKDVNGFTKMVTLPELKPIIHIPIFTRGNDHFVHIEPVINLTPPSYQQKDFRLIRHKIVKQSKNSKVICFAVYEEI